MKKKLFSLVMAMAMVLSLAACGGDNNKTPAAANAKVDTNTVAVGAVVIARDDVPEDDIYAFVSAIFENIDTITEQHSKGGELDLAFASSVTSVPYHPGAAKYFAEKGKTVAADNVQLGFVQSDVMSYAYNGERLFDHKVDSFSVVAALYMEQVQIVTTNPDIKSVADLAGKTVSIGDRGSGVWFNACDVLQAYGIDPDTGISPVYQGFGDSADSLKDGKIDAAFVVAGAPTNAIVDLATAKPVYLVSLDDSHTNDLLKSSPYYSAYTIKAGTY